MIPVSLEFSGLNSYRDLQSIDFSQLMSQGLFGIFGVTGAGKSTVLDAMTLALFGQVKRAPRQTQGIINAREQRCRVRFVFRLSGHCYTAERLFERVKGDPYSCSAKSCRLVEDGSLVLADKAKVMDDAIEGLLNMNCERFCQTVILPQGQFDQLLHMKPADRSKMLEELFHYQDYGEALVRRCRERLRRAEEQVSRLEEKAALLGPCDDGYLADLRQKQQEAEARISEVSRSLAEAEAERNRLENLAALDRERQLCRRALAELEERAEYMAALRVEAEAAKAAEPLRHALDEAVELNRQTKEAKSGVDAALREHRQAEAEQERSAAALTAQINGLEKQRSQVKPRLHDLELACREKTEAEDIRGKLRELQIASGQVGLAAAVAELEQRLSQTQKERRQAAVELKELRQREKAAMAGWEQAIEVEKTAQRQNAAALLAESLREGEPCPVCGSLHHQPGQHQGADIAAASRLVQQTRQTWEGLQRQVEQKESAAQSLADREQAQSTSLQQKKDELTAARTQLSAWEQSLAEKDASWQKLAGCDDPAGELRRLQDDLEQADKEAERLRQSGERALARLNEARLKLEKASTALEEREGRLADLRRQLLLNVEQAGFDSANAARSALRQPAQRQDMEGAVKEYDDRLLGQQLERGRLEEALRGFDPGAVAPAQSRAAGLAAEEKTLLDLKGRLTHGLEKAEEAARAAAELLRQRGEAQSRADVLRRLSTLLKGNAFVRYLARGSLLELAHESSDILLSLTCGRYRLELTEDGGSDFILADNNGGLRRQISGLSGGETFLVSLALALALSAKIQMHAAPLGFFFLDEGFGSLDGASLEAAMAVLEKLPSDRRAVGLITHVREVRERVPRYLEVIADPVHGSRVILKKN